MYSKYEIRGSRWKYPRPARCFFMVSIYGLILVSWCGVASASAVCGDANGDGNANVGDPVYLINYVFKGGPPPEPMYLADINRDGSVNVGDVVYMIAWIFRAGPPPTCDPYGYVAGYGECKSSVKASKTDSIPPDQDCISYQYNESGVLSLQHINAAFNCCVDDIIVDLYSNGDTILIQEAEVNPNCRCLCLYDLDIVVTNLPPGQYFIKVIEPYAQEGDPPLEFPVDLAVVPSGNFCAGRDHYPWQPPTPSTGHGMCKQYAKDLTSGSHAYNEDCLQFNYDGAGVLKLTHINGAFNCCPDSISAIVQYPHDPGNILVVTETEFAIEPCNCLCLFDVYHTIPIFVPGTYTIRVVGMYLEPDDEVLEVTVDLTEPISGSKCITRTYQPWHF
jgi:Dockerin type I domain